MSDRKIIAVVGATGAQGGGLVRAISADPSGGFSARALTRDAGSERAKELAALGAEVVEADLDDETALRGAFDGAHGAFVVTNFWEPRTEEDQRRRSASQRELSQAANAARAAKEAGTRHVIWSTLPDTRPYFPAGDQQAATFDGGYKVPHADGKAEANRFFAESGVPTTYLQANVYYEAFLDPSLFGPRRDEQGRLVLAPGFADARVAAHAAEDLGRTAYGIFRKGEAMAGRAVSVAGSILTGAQYAEALTKALGEPVAYLPTGPDTVRAAGFPGAEEVANMLAYFVAAESDIARLVDEDLLHELNPRLQSFDTWLRGRPADLTIR
ncbi:nucleotide-diphosphate-sugar epimerase [Sphaerisporangium melleum]|uniref:Nucleotide-diphosphate-sugar epimerase n=1 Tax=Sphaerisporangium melleum TaxID=321316 RepID=A0A917VW99_9ACTN|nr:NmrA/HSCARG family protein [Sphaerisporangium melleum]GGL20788.1 nucleotide-diphosphate-sugar epimerase [Sphaerisporangium melleum]GII73485.1 nucleotide-diphosphate-sugar epimerase [Sphaerisporangium melleum]